MLTVLLTGLPARMKEATITIRAIDHRSATKTQAQIEESAKKGREWRKQRESGLMMCRTTAEAAADAACSLANSQAMHESQIRSYYPQFGGAVKACADVLTVVRKICLSHLVVSLANFEEFNKRFNRVIPYEHRPAVKGLMRSIEEKGITTFRNKCVGNVWDNEQGRRTCSF
jgi:hypothetical protein